MKPNSTFTALLFSATVCAFLFSTVHVANAQTITSNTQNWNSDGYFYSFWSSAAPGPVVMNVGRNGNYDVQWNNFYGDFTCGTGWASGWPNHTIGYNAGVYWQNGGGSLAVYGWTTNGLVEYYVNEIWNGYSRPTGSTYKGRIVSDGAYYDVYYNWQSNQPSIQGYQSFPQYISTRDQQNSSGTNNTVTLQNHINAWASYGMYMGNNFNYQILLTESWGSGVSGHVNATVW